MIQIRYIGTGEAFDHRLPNTSMVYEGERRILIDCGYAVPHALWSHSRDPNWLDAIYLSHFHADHCFGLPALLARMGEDGRERSLTIFGGPGSKEATNTVLQTGYPRMLEKLPFPLEQVEIPPESPARFGALTLKVAQSHHSVPNYSLRIEEDTMSLCYSGDGGPSEATQALFSGCSLLIHEAYHPELQTKQSHASVPQVMAMAKQLRVEQLHLIHLKRDAPLPTGATVPVPGQIYLLKG
ncbi:MAG TPA: ribonuclease Z [Myxococcales bacterium]|nr:ribonuclease Z [Myxococcales bacterium]